MGSLNGFNHNLSNRAGTIHVKSLKPCCANQRLPSFSEFLSFTFPEVLQAEKEKVIRVKGLPKVRSVSLVSSPMKDSLSNNFAHEHGRYTSLKNDVPEVKHPSESDMEDRTSFKAVQSCDEYGNIKEALSRDPKMTKDPKLLKPAMDGCHLMSSTAKRKEPSPFAQRLSHHPISIPSHHGTDEQPVKKRKHCTHVSKSYSCSFCPLFFFYQKHLITHVKEKHEKKKPFGCPRDGCWQRFGGLGDVNRHVKTVHDGEKRFSCQMCERCFSRRSGLKRHIVHVHRSEHE